MPIIVSCPTCAGQLRVADELIGRKVRCPACSSTFEACQAPAPPAAPPAPQPPVETERIEPWKQLNLELSEPTSETPKLPAAPPGTPLSGAVEINLSLDAPSRETPSSDPPERESRRPRLNDEHDDLRPCPECGKMLHRDARRCYACGERLQEGSRRDEDDDEDDDYRIRRRPRRDCESHRGGLILTFGIISIATLFMCWPLCPLALGFGIAAWVMGQSDLRKIRNGVMDPEGLGATQAGWICSIIGTCLNVLILLVCGGYLSFIAIAINQSTRQLNRPAFPAPPAVKKF